MTAVLYTWINCSNTSFLITWMRWRPVQHTTDINALFIFVIVPVHTHCDGTLMVINVLTNAHFFSLISLLPQILHYASIIPYASTSLYYSQNYASIINSSLYAGVIVDFLFVSVNAVVQVWPDHTRHANTIIAWGAKEVFQLERIVSLDTVLTL